jgi:putative addiction module component (TIGR02574 family)
MTNFAEILSAAQQLPTSDRLKLIDALWDIVPPDSEPAFGEEWTKEIELRVKEIDSGKVSTIPWSTIRDEALARLGHGKGG